MDTVEEINAQDANSDDKNAQTPCAPKISSTNNNLINTDTSNYYRSSSIRFRCLETMMPEKYKPNMILEAKVNKIIGQGSYGTVFLIENSAYVVKLFWETNSKTFDKPEDCVEFNFWKNVIQKVKKEGIPWPDNWCEVYIIGTTIRTEKFDQKWFPSGTPILLMPYYYKWDEIFNNTIDIRRNPIRLWFVWKTLLEATCNLESNWNIVHLDLKLGNIMIDRHGQLRIIDFGLIQEKLDDYQLFSPYQQYQLQNKKRIYSNIHQNIYKELYYIWPPIPSLLTGVMSYSLALLQLEIIYGKTIYKFQGTRTHWFKYLEDLQYKNYPKEWLNLLHLSSSTAMNVCILYEKVNHFFQEESKKNIKWKESWDNAVSKNVNHNHKWRAATIVNYMYNDEDPMLCILQSGSTTISPQLTLSINAFNDTPKNHITHFSSTSSTYDDVESSSQMNDASA